MADEHRPPSDPSSAPPYDLDSLQESIDKLPKNLPPLPAGVLAKLLRLRLLDSDRLWWLSKTRREHITKLSRRRRTGQRDVVTIARIGDSMVSTRNRLVQSRPRPPMRQRQILDLSRTRFPRYEQRRVDTGGSPWCCVCWWTGSLSKSSGV